MLNRRRSASDKAVEIAPRQYPELKAGNEPHLFTQFATKIGGLSQRQAEAMYWKDWFWTGREGHIAYPDEPSSSRMKAAG